MDSVWWLMASWNARGSISVSFRLAILRYAEVITREDREYIPVHIYAHQGHSSAERHEFLSISLFFKNEV